MSLSFHTTSRVHIPFFSASAARSFTLFHPVQEAMVLGNSTRAETKVPTPGAFQPATVGFSQY